MRALILGVAMLLLATPALAQEATPSATPTLVTVPVGVNDFSVDGDEPLTACVVNRDESIDDGIFVTLQVLVRVDTGDYVPVLSYRTRATGVLREAHVEQCFVLAGEK